MQIKSYPDDDDDLLRSLLEYIKKSGQKKLYLTLIKHLDKLEIHGFEINKLFKKDAIKRLEIDIYELRPDNIRILFTVIKEDIWLLTWFIKKTDKTPEIEKQKARIYRKKLVDKLESGK